MSLVHCCVPFVSILALLLKLMIVVMFVLAIDADSGCW
jgi:hypothetical protein